MDGFIFIPILAVVGFSIYYFFYSEKAKIKRKFKKTQHKKISEFKDGDVAKFTGIIESIDEPLISPLSRRKCTHYNVLVEQEVSSGKSSHWKKLIARQDSNTFIIRGANGCAFIEGGKMKRHIVVDREFSSGFMNDPKIHLKEYLEQHGHKNENFIGMNKTIRYKEGILELGEKVAVLGKGVWKMAEELSLPAELGKVLAITDHGDEYVYFTDDEETTHIAEQKLKTKQVKVKPQSSVTEEYERRNEEMKKSTREPKRRRKNLKREGRYLK